MIKNFWGLEVETSGRSEVEAIGSGWTMKTLHTHTHTHTHTYIYSVCIYYISSYIYIYDVCAVIYI